MSSLSSILIKVLPITVAATTTQPATTQPATTNALTTTNPTPVKKTKKNKDLAIVLFAMQAMNPLTSMNPQSVLPLLLMKDNTSNKELIMFMSMMYNM